jgi:shikimate dehydrogenase
MSKVFVGGVIGHPISHSLSPEIFDYISFYLKVPVVYQRIDVVPKDLHLYNKIFRDISLLNGWNVTIPHKETIVKQIDDLSAEAKVLGAVNVVKVLRGKLIGYNTDVHGVLKTLSEQKIRIAGSSNLIFGAGGAALSVGYALGSKGADQVWILNRNHLRAKKMAKTLNFHFPKTRFLPVLPNDLNTITSPVQLLVNATPLGMKGFPNRSPLSNYGLSKFFKNCSKEALAFDLVYRPVQTCFLDDAAKLGIRRVGGLDMLIWQALAAWEIWMGKVPEPKKLKNQLSRHLLKRLEGVSE